MNRYALALGLLALGCNGSDDETASGDEVDGILALEPDLDNGATLFADNCAVCHGDDGAGIQDLGSDIRNETDQREVIELVLDGNDEGMTPFRGLLSEQEIADVSAFVTEGNL